MRRRIARLVLLFLCLLLGATLLGLALFAYQFGLDNDPGWGRGRYLLAVSGGVLLFVALGLRIGPGLMGGFARSAWYRRLVVGASAIAKSRPITAINRAGRSAAQAFGKVRLFRVLSCSAAFFAGLGFVIVVLVYLWYLTSGRMTEVTSFTAYFDRLGSAFYAGQLHLPEKPTQALLALDNPYDYRNRENVYYLWDAVLYQGKYYFYWGAVPGVIVWAVKLFAGPATVVEDQYLVFAFTVGLNLMIALLLVRLRSSFYPIVPAWTLLPLVLLAGLAVHVLWLISSPNVYEVAIAGGQFFLFLGLYVAGEYITRENGGPGWLLAAGFAWGAAVNCRLNIAVAVGFLVLMLVWRELRREKTFMAAVGRLSWLGVPFILWIVAMGGYNFARFGSALETGHRYQLTGITLTQNYSDTFSFSYVPPNLYSYLIRPLTWNPDAFPMVFAPFIKETMWPWWMRLPKHYYYSEQVAGVFAAIPATLAVLLPLLGWVWVGWQWINERSEPRNANPEERWLWLWLAGGAVCLFVPLLAFISSSMRYLVDVVPLLVVLTALGIWKTVTELSGHPFLRSVLLLSFVVLVIVSIVVSLLVNFTNGSKRFATENPALFAEIVRFFNKPAP